MSKEEKLKDIIKLLEWGLMTIEDKLKFGLPEEVAIQRRELRVKGILEDSLEQLKEILNEDL